MTKRVPESLQEQVEYDGSTPLKNASYEKFCQEAIALNDFNAAYLAAGFKRPRGNSHRLARLPEVSKRLTYLWCEAAKTVALMGGRWLMAADTIANANMLDFWDIDPKTGEPVKLNLAKIPRALGAAIKEISYTRDGQPKLMLHDVPAMLKFLIERASPRKLELSGTDGAPLVVNILRFTAPADGARLINPSEERSAEPPGVVDATPVTVTIKKFGEPK